jgi:hypothetical protein
MQVRDRLLELLEALAIEDINAEKLINEECLQVCLRAYYHAYALALMWCVCVCVCVCGVWCVCMCVSQLLVDLMITAHTMDYDRRGAGVALKATAGTLMLQDSAVAPTPAHIPGPYGGHEASGVLLTSPDCSVVLPCMHVRVCVCVCACV